MGSLAVEAPSTLSPAPTVTLTDNTQSSGYYFAGDSFTLSVTGPPGQPVSVTINGVYYGQLANADGTPAVTNANGIWSTSQTWSAANVGSYTETWYAGGVQAGPGPVVFQIYGLAPLTSSAVPQLPPANTPAPIVYPVASNQTTNCNDVSGTWVDTPSPVGTTTWSLYQEGTTITNASTLTEVYPGGQITWSVSGTSVGGVVTLVASNPNPAFDVNDLPAANPLNVILTLTGCGSGSAQETDTYPTYSNGFQTGQITTPTTTTYWAAISSPPGLLMTVNLLTDQVGLVLTGQNKTGPLTVVINAPANNPATTTLASVSDATALLVPTYSLQRTTLSPGQYTAVVATWDDITLTVPVSFYVLGNTRFTQYNTPYASTCSGNPQTAYVFNGIGATSCSYEIVQLPSGFISRVDSSTSGTGTGVAQINGTNQVLKGYYAGAGSLCALPTNANGDGSNTFYSVDAGGVTIQKITGAYTRNNTVLSDATNNASPLNNNNPGPLSTPAGTGSVAVFPAGNVPAAPFIFGDQILLVGANDANDPLGYRSVVDLCPACNPNSVTSPVIAKIDMYSSSHACSGVTDYITGEPITAIRLR